MAVAEITEFRGGAAENHADSESFVELRGDVSGLPTVFRRR
jgi:hypothetical protein